MCHALTASGQDDPDAQSTRHLERRQRSLLLERAMRNHSLSLLVTLGFRRMFNLCMITVGN